MPRHSLMFLATMLMGCPPSHDDPIDPNRVARVVTSAEGDTGVVVSGHNDFTWDTYANLAAIDDGNLFFSPFSITSALGMTMAGANGTTETEMRSVLHSEGDEAAWHTALGALTRDLNGDLGRGYTLNIANKLYGQADYAWEAPFLAVCADDYGAPLEPWDFVSDPEGGRTAVNDWVEATTNNKIVDLLPEGSVTSDTRLILANAIYFLGDWATAFDPEDTRDGTFTRGDGSTITVPMMTMALEDVEDSGIEVARTSDATLLRLPYQDDEVSMILVIPYEQDGLAAVAGQLDAATWATWTSGFGPSDAYIGMPKIEMSYKVDLGPTLSDLGMPTAFSDGSDFTGMSAGPEQLRISGVFHQAFVKVDEAGTEAAAATGVVVGTDSAPEPIFADHPFLMVIQDDLTGAILFVGRVSDPS